MANLRTNNLSGEGGRNAYNGSLFFDGDSSYLALGSGVVPSFGTGDFTIEFWINQGVNPLNYTVLISMNASTASDRFEVAIHSSTIHVYTDTGAWRDTGYAPVSGVYEHIVFQRDSSGNTLKMYANGEEKWSVSNTRDYDETFTETKIGSYASSSYGYFQGYLSNLRICIGHTVYSSNYFSPPTSPLTVHYTAEDDKTVLLCCQDFDNPIQEATGRTIIGYGDFQRADDVELITNGTFNSATTGWTAVGGATLSVSSGQLVITGDGSAGGGAAQSFTTVAGKKYILTYDVANGTISAGQIRIGTSANGYEITYDNSVSEASNKDIVFTATNTTTYVTLGLNAGILTSGSFEYDNVSVTLIDGSEKSSGSTKVIPPYGVDAGNIFNGAISMNSPSYMYFPTGRTEERGGTRACWFRGYVQAGANDNTIDFSEMSSKGNAQDFADTLTSNRQAGALGSSTRGVFGGRDGGSNVIEFVTFSTQSNSLDFGDFTAARAGAPATASDGTRGLFFGGYAPNIANANIIEYITIASSGNGADFGDLTDKPSEPSGCASPTRGIKMGGRTSPSPSNSDVIDYTTIQTLGNATDFGNLTVARFEAGGASSTTRGVMIAGYSYSPNTGRNTIDYITIASTGDAQDFGDLTAYTQSWQGGSGSNNVIIAHGIGYNNSARDNRIDFITIATTGNSADYGDLTNQRSQIPCATNGHGGLS